MQTPTNYNVTKQSLINQIIPKLTNPSVTKTTLLQIANGLHINTSNIHNTNNNNRTRNTNLREFNRRLNKYQKQQNEYGSP